MQINIIGFGNMGQAMARALIRNNYKGRVIATDHRRIKIPGVAFDTGFKTLAKADIVVIGVKPQDVMALAEEMAGKVAGDAIIISIAAGVTIAKLQKIFRHQKIVRVMPNLGILVGRGIAAWKAAGLSSADKKRVQDLLGAICSNFEVADEKLIDAVTAISGSGPAYFFAFAESLTKAGRKLGLSAAQSRMLVEATFTGAAVLQQGRDYGELITQVRSKKGTTDAALKVFDKRNMGAIINEAVIAAHRRAGELSK